MGKIYEVRTYENYVIIPQSYIIPSFQVRQAFPLATPKKTAKAVLVKKTKEKNFRWRFIT